MSSSTIADADLLARFRIAVGNQRDLVFGEIFHLHRSRVHRLCMRLVGNRSTAEDALQETFLEVYKGLRGFRGDSQLSTWIYRVAMRTALRLRARHPTRTDTDDVGPTPEDARDPQAGLIAREQARAVNAALDRLPGEQRAVVALFLTDGLTHGEIASILGVPEGTVWSRLHKARKTMAKALK